MIVSLFPYPFCASCFEQLHPLHHGWDICHECYQMGEEIDDVSCGCYDLVDMDRRAKNIEELKKRYGERQWS